MNTLKIHYTGESSLLPAAEIIKSGGLVAFPTETVYGLGANALDASAASRIYAAKGRPSDNPLIVHLADWHDADSFCYTNPLFEEIADAFMPGPLTVILPKKDIIPITVTGGLDSVGIRVPTHPAAHQLITLSACPIAAPSANISGKPSPTCFAHIEHDLDGRVDCLINGGDSDFGVESTIIKIEEHEITVLRPGAITVEMLSVFTDRVVIDPSVVGKYDGIPMAPGMKYRHYAPDLPLTILDGPDDAVYRFLSDKQRIGVICFDEDLPHIRASHVYSCGRVNDSLAHARTLFGLLRKFENQRDIDCIYARMPSKSGIGLAVFNRLIKASGFTVITLSSDNN